MKGNGTLMLLHGNRSRELCELIRFQSATRMNEAKICQACPSQNSYNAGSESDGYEVWSTFLCAVVEKIWESPK